MLYEKELAFKKIHINTHNQESMRLLDLFSIRAILFLFIIFL